jgi:hypothetical protein
MMRITPASKECKDCVCLSHYMATRQKGMWQNTSSELQNTHTHTQQAPYFHKDFEHGVPLLIIQEQSTIDWLGR